METTEVKRDLTNEVPGGLKFKRLKSNEEVNKDIIDYLDNVTDSMEND